jgi:hypothetical protein
MSAESGWYRVFFNELYDSSKYRSQGLWAVGYGLGTEYVSDCFIGFSHNYSTNHINLYIMKDPNSRTSWFSQCRFVNLSHGGIMIYAGLQETVTNNTTQIRIEGGSVNGIGTGSQIIIYGGE